MVSKVSSSTPSHLDAMDVSLNTLPSSQTLPAEAISVKKTTRSTVDRFRNVMLPLVLAGAGAVSTTDSAQAENHTKYAQTADLSNATMLVETGNTGSVDVKIMEKRMGLPFSKAAAEGFERDIHTLTPVQKNIVLRYYTL